MRGEQKTVVITGATAGIGRAAAVEFARRGYNVGLIARDSQALAETRRELDTYEVRSTALEADVADAAAIEAAAERAEQELGPIDIWVNSAMATIFSPVEKITAEEYREVTATTYLGYVHGTLAALKRMRPRDRGTIVQVGSALAYRSIPLQSAYCGAKAAIRGFTDSLRSELIHDHSHVKVTMVQLPAHNTPQFDWARNRLDQRLQPMPPIYQPEVAARAIYRAAVEQPRELWVGRSTLMAIVGTGLAPTLLDRMLAKRAYNGQTTGEAADMGRDDNLEHPVTGFHAEHGRFDQRSKSTAMSVKQETLTTIGLAAVGAGVAAALAGAISTRRH